MRRLLAASLIACAAALAGCNQEQPVTKKADGYSEKLTAAEVIFVDEPRFYERMQTRTSGSLSVSEDSAMQSVEKDLAAYARRIEAELPAKVAASGIDGHVSVLPPAKVRDALKAAPKALVIYPVGGRTRCSPCYSVVTFRADIIHGGLAKPVWSTDAKALVGRPEGVEQMWDGAVAALRADGLLAK